MAMLQPTAPPPGFEQLSKEQQIDYVQQLWDFVVAAPEEVPVPAWHLEIVQERMNSQPSETLNSWQDVKQRLLGKYGE